MKIYLITYNETKQYNQKGEATGTLCTPLTMVSHGLDEEFRTIVLPVEPLDYFIKTCRARLDTDVGLYWI